MMEKNAHPALGMERCSVDMPKPLSKIGTFTRLFRAQCAKDLAKCLMKFARFAMAQNTCKSSFLTILICHVTAKSNALCAKGLVHMREMDVRSVMVQAKCGAVRPSK